MASAEAVAQRFGVPLTVPKKKRRAGKKGVGGEEEVEEVAELEGEEEETHDQRVSRLLRALEPLAAALSAASASRSADPGSRRRAGEAAAGRALRGRLAGQRRGAEKEKEEGADPDSSPRPSREEREAFWQASLLTELGCDPRANAACKAAAKVLLEPCFAAAGISPPPNGGDLLAARVSSLLCELSAAPAAPDTAGGREAALLCAARARILGSAARALGVPLPARRKEGKGEESLSSLSPSQQQPRLLELQPPTAASKREESPPSPPASAGEQTKAKKKGGKKES